MSATTGVTNNGPTTGSCCNGCRSDVCGTAMTRGAVSVAARALDTGSTSSDVVTGLTALLRLGVLPDSCRAAAIIIHGKGDSTGAVGELPANGFWTALTMFDIAVVATSTRACGFCFGVSTITSAVFGTDETDTLAVGAGSSAAFGSSEVLVCSVASERTVRAVAVPVLPVDSAASWVGLLHCREVVDFFFRFGVGSTMDFVSLESVDVLAFFSAGCSDDDVDAAPDEPVDEPLDVDDDPDPEVSPVSADATPCPTRTAAPIPRATANPPIRPTYAPAPIPMYLPSTRAPVRGLAESVPLRRVGKFRR
jgi:hypothetical protein